MVTCIDETFVLQTLENNYQHWKDKAWLPDIKDRDTNDKQQEQNDLMPSKYTNLGRANLTDGHTPSRVGHQQALPICRKK